MDNTTTDVGGEIIAGKIFRRNILRKQEVERRKEEKEQSSVTTEKPGYFNEVFMNKQHEIEDYLSSALTGQIEKGDLANLFDKVSKEIQNLQSFLSVSTVFLRVYDVRKSQEVIQSLQQRCQELEQQLLPKKKFGFKTRKAKKEEFDEKLKDTVDSPTISKLIPAKVFVDYTENSCGFNGRIGEILSLSHDVINKKDLMLSNLENCTIKLTGTPSTLHMSSLKKCIVLCGPVTTSIFIDSCCDSKFVLACQQLRIHNTRHCDFYLHVTSRAIIEDTTDVRFAPYNWKYEHISQHFQMAGLDLNRNNWTQIDDFNWLATDKPSPNWQLMEECEYNPDWVL